MQLLVEDEYRDAGFERVRNHGGRDLAEQPLAHPRDETALLRTAPTATPDFEIGFLPPVKFLPGLIGGHCIMPNIEILNELGPSEILRAIRSSNEQKKAREENLVVLEAGAAGDRH